MHNLQFHDIPFNSFLKYNNELKLNQTSSFTGRYVPILATVKTKYYYRSLFYNLTLDNNDNKLVQKLELQTCSYEKIQDLLQFLLLYYSPEENSLHKLKYSNTLIKLINDPDIFDGFNDDDKPIKKMENGTEIDLSGLYRIEREPLLEEGIELRTIYNVPKNIKLYNYINNSFYEYIYVEDTTNFVYFGNDSILNTNNTTFAGYSINSNIEIDKFGNEYRIVKKEQNNIGKIYRCDVCTFNKTTMSENERKYHYIDTYTQKEVKFNELHIPMSNLERYHWYMRTLKGIFFDPKYKPVIVNQKSFIELDIYKRKNKYTQTISTPLTDISKNLKVSLIPENNYALQNNIIESRANDLENIFKIDSETDFSASLPRAEFSNILDIGLKENIAASKDIDGNIKDDFIFSFTIKDNNDDGKYLREGPLILNTKTNMDQEFSNNHLPKKAYSSTYSNSGQDILEPNIHPYIPIINIFQKGDSIIHCQSIGQTVYEKIKDMRVVQFTEFIDSPDISETTVEPYIEYNLDGDVAEVKLAEVTKNIYTNVFLTNDSNDQTTFNQFKKDIRLSLNFNDILEAAITAGYHMTPQDANGIVSEGDLKTIYSNSLYGIMYNMLQSEKKYIYSTSLSTVDYLHELYIYIDGLISLVGNTFALAPKINTGTVYKNIHGQITTGFIPIVSLSSSASINEDHIIDKDDTTGSIEFVDNKPTTPESTESYTSIFDTFKNYTPDLNLNEKIKADLEYLNYGQEALEDAENDNTVSGNDFGNSRGDDYSSKYTIQHNNIKELKPEFIKLILEYFYSTTIPTISDTNMLFNMETERDKDLIKDYITNFKPKIFGEMYINEEGHQRDETVDTRIVFVNNDFKLNENIFKAIFILNKEDVTEHRENYIATVGLTEEEGIENG